MFFWLSISIGRETLMFLISRFLFGMVNESAKVAVVLSYKIYLILKSAMTRIVNISMCVV